MNEPVVLSYKSPGIPVKKKKNGIPVKKEEEEIPYLTLEVELISFMTLKSFKFFLSNMIPTSNFPSLFNIWHFRYLC